MSVATKSTEGIMEKSEALVANARSLFETKPHWITFWREVFGGQGLIQQFYVVPPAIAAFSRTPAYDELRGMLADLRSKDDESSCHLEPQRVVTIRMPKSLHDALKAEAHDENTSLNKLAIGKLLQPLWKKEEKTAAD